MTINIKRRSGTPLMTSLEVQLELAKLWHNSLADMYREKYALVPVTIKKHRLPRAAIHKVRSALIEGAKYTLQRQYIKDCCYD